MRLCLMSKYSHKRNTRQQDVQVHLAVEKCDLHRLYLPTDYASYQKLQYQYDPVHSL